MTHFDTLEADFTRYYQTDLPAAIWGPNPISARRLGVLLRGLPPDSALGRELTPHSGWGNVEELLAATIERIDYGNRILHGAYCEQPHPDPVKVPRPWDSEPARPKMATSEEMVSFFRRSGSG